MNNKLGNIQVSKLITSSITEAIRYTLICEYRISLIKFNISPSRIVFDKLVSFAPGTSRCAAFGSVRRDASKFKLGDHS